MNPIEWALRPIRRYADFSGRAPRAEYWWYTLAITLFGFLVEYVDGWIGTPVIGAFGPATLMFELGLLIPGIAVLVRRLHDINRSGWWALLAAGSYAFLGVGLVTSDPEAAMQGVERLGPPTLIALVLAWVIMMIVLLFFTVTRGNEGPNRFGPDPYGPGHLEEIFA